MQSSSLKYAPNVDDSDLVAYCKLGEDPSQDPTVELVESDRLRKQKQFAKKSYFNDSQQLIVYFLTFTGIFSAILFNLWPSTFPNACGGADIYLVVCGFVAAIKCAYLPAEQFYRQHYQQIVPIYAIILFFVLLLTNGPFFNSDAFKYVQSTAAALGFLSNQLDYTRPIRELKASFLGHLWLPSLIVQFYVLSPILWHFLRTETHRRARWTAACGIALFSLIYSLRADLRLFNRPYESTRLSRKLVDELSVDFFARLWPFFVGFALAVLVIPELDAENDQPAIERTEKVALKESLSSPAHSPRAGKDEVKQPLNFYEIDLSAVSPSTGENSIHGSNHSGDLHRYGAIALILLVTIVLMPDLGAGGPFAALFLRQCTVMATAVTLLASSTTSAENSAVLLGSLAEATTLVGRSALIWYLLHWPITYAAVRIFLLGYLEGGLCAFITSLALAVGLQITVADWIEKLERFTTVLIISATFYVLCIILIIQQVFF